MTVPFDQKRDTKLVLTMNLQRLKSDPETIWNEKEAGGEILISKVLPLKSDSFVCLTQELT